MRCLPRRDTSPIGALQKGFAHRPESFWTGVNAVLAHSSGSVDLIALTRLAAARRRRLD
jgi:hypothetical protein